MMREKILQATAAIIADEGAKAASTRSICRALGVSAPTLYHYFENKIELMNAVTAWSFERHMQHIDFSNTELGIEEVLRQAWDRYMDFALNETALYRTMILSIAQGNVFEPGQRCFRMLLHTFKLAAKNGFTNHDPLEAAQIYLSAAQGMAMTILTFPLEEGGRREQLSKNTRDLLLRDLLRPLNAEA